jgi:hypothetical protein
VAEALLTEVLRVEHHGDGEGPYRGVDGLREMYLTHNGDDYPTPWNDGIDYRDGMDEYFCGLADSAAFAHWFGDWRGPLHAAGYVLRTYLVPASALAPGNYQVMFRKKDAAMIREESLVRD